MPARESLVNDQLVEEALQGWEVGYSWLCSPKTLTFLTKWTTGSSAIVIIKQTTIPILTILRHWRYCSMHIQYQRGCPTGRCRNLGWRSREAVVTRDYALGLETGRRTDHERLRMLPRPHCHRRRLCPHKAAPTPRHHRNRQSFSEPTANTCRQHTPLPPPDTTTNAAHTPLRPVPSFSLRFLHLASPQHASHHTVPQ